MKVVAGQVGQARSVAGLENFSFHKTPVLVIENFWSADERGQFREAMARANWNQLQEMSYVRQDFPEFRELGEAEIAMQGRLFWSRLELPAFSSISNHFPTSPAVIWGSATIPMEPVIVC